MQRNTCTSKIRRSVRMVCKKSVFSNLMEYVMFHLIFLHDHIYVHVHETAFNPCLDNTERKETERTSASMSHHPEGYQCFIYGFVKMGGVGALATFVFQFDLVIPKEYLGLMPAGENGFQWPMHKSYPASGRKRKLDSCQTRTCSPKISRTTFQGVVPKSDSFCFSTKSIPGTSVTSTVASTVERELTNANK